MPFAIILHSSHSITFDFCLIIFCLLNYAFTFQYLYKEHFRTTLQHVCYIWGNSSKSKKRFVQIIHNKLSTIYFNKLRKYIIHYSIIQFCFSQILICIWFGKCHLNYKSEVILFSHNQIMQQYQSWSKNVHPKCLPSLSNQWNPYLLLQRTHFMLLLHYSRSVTIL